MRALYGLGKAHFESGDSDAAIICFKEIIKLNPHDNLGARYSLVHWLIISW